MVNGVVDTPSDIVSQICKIFKSIYPLPLFLSFCKVYHFLTIRTIKEPPFSEEFLIKGGLSLLLKFCFSGAGSAVVPA